MSGKNYQELTAWQEAMNLVETIYRISKGFPKEEQFGLATQIRRAAVSVPSNISEGQGRRAPREFSHFLSIAHGSVREVETQILIAKRLRYVDDASTQTSLEQAGSVGRLIIGLSNSLRERNE